jgi:N-acetylglutamate synthase-like GNAT family acetyltransferase
MRRAGPADVAAIRNLTRAAYAKWVPLIGREPAPMKTDYAKAVTECWVDVLEENDKIIAVIHMEPRANHLYIDNIAVAEDQQGKGLSRELLAHAEMIARAASLPELRLLTNKAFASNLALYRHLGFEIDAEVPHPESGVIVHFRRPVSQS